MDVFSSCGPTGHPLTPLGKILRCRSLSQVAAGPLGFEVVGDMFVFCFSTQKRWIVI